MRAAAAIAQQPDWRDALASLTAQMAPLSEGGAVDVAFLFASSQYADEFSQLAREVHRTVGARILLGCSGYGVIGPSREIEALPALALLAFSLPDATLYPGRLTEAAIEACAGPEDWQRLMGARPGDVNAWFLFVDPFTMDAERLLAGLSDAYPGTPLVGGLASGDPRQRGTHVFLDSTVYDTGAVALGLGGRYGVRTIVSQGCAPIGEAWTITGVRDHIIETIGQRPAYEVLVDTVRALSPEIRQRARWNLFVGLAMNEYRDEFRRGDFLIRNIVGADPERGLLAVGALPRVGQTIQFQLRDPAAADEDLRALLAAAKQELGEQQPVAALLCSCNGRGIGLFGSPDHDARTVAEFLGPVPLAGFFCNGEIGPVGGTNFLHGYTASLALIVPVKPNERN